MRLLIIDNGTKHLESLQAICSKHDCSTVALSDLAALVSANSSDKDESQAGGRVNDYDAIILSGSYDLAVVEGERQYTAELDLIRSADLPILGICIGFELICYAFGCDLVKMADKVEGPAVITPTEDGARVFQGTDPIKVHEAHRWAVEDVPKQLVVLARSDNGIEAVKHKTRAVYGLQFHPEQFAYASDGKMVFENILAMFAKQAKKKTA